MNQVAKTFVPHHRHVVMLAFPECELIDVSGPMSVFSFANYALKLAGRSSEVLYDLTVVAEQAGPVKTFSNISIHADHSYESVRDGIDTLLIAGGINVEQAMYDEKIKKWLQDMMPRVRRIGSICTGAFVLAESGLLDYRNATTHWHFCSKLASQYRNIRVDPEKIFVRDGNIYTSGGVTAGIDMALSLVEEDWGWDIAALVARGMLIFMRRPGGQSQFSTYVINEAKTRKDFRELQAYIISHIDHDLSVEKLAEHMSMSPRNFARIFCQEVGITPAKFVERVRLEAARNMMLQTDLPVESVAVNCGFNNSEQMRRSFYRLLKITPHEYRSNFK